MNKERILEKILTILATLVFIFGIIDRNYELIIATILTMFYIEYLGGRK